MTRFFQDLFPREFIQQSAYLRALALASMYLLLIVTELFTFEDFWGVMKGFGLPGGDVATTLCTGLMPLLAAASLPYLMSMRIPYNWWKASRLVMIATPVVWLCIYATAIFRGQQEVPAGIFGATFAVGLTWWVVAFVVLLLVSAIVVARELPYRHEQKH